MPKKLKVNKKSPVKSREVPATSEMLFEVRDELKRSVSSLESKMDSRFDQMDSKFSDIDSKFSSIDSRFNQMDSKFDKLMAEVHRIGLLVEEQNARNIYVLDGYTSLNDRLEKLESL